MFAVKVLNLLQSIHGILSGAQVLREIPIFGAPFDDDTLLMGIIDEIRCDQDNFTLDLVEFKTRCSNSLPSKVQTTSHELQAIVYKQLFDDLVAGKTSKSLIAKQMHLDFARPLGAGVMSHVAGAGFADCSTLDKLWDVLQSRATALPVIGRILIEYCYQADSSTIAVKEVSTSVDEVRPAIDHYLKFWSGQREVCTSVTYMLSCLHS